MIDPNLIRNNLIAYMKVFDGLPETFSHDGEDTFWFVSLANDPGQMVLRTDFSSENAEALIDATLEQVANVVDHIDWWIFPSDTPPDMKERLERRDLVGNLAGNWLWKDLTTPDLVTTVHPDFRIARVDNDDMMARWSAVSEEGFGRPLPQYHEAYRRHGYGADSYSDHYIGFVGHEAVTSGTLLDAGGSASIYDLSTPTRFRKQGFAGAMMRALLDIMRNRGYEETWIWSSDMAKPLYMELGYVEADFGIREFPWKKP